MLGVRGKDDGAGRLKKNTICNAEFFTKVPKCSELMGYSTAQMYLALNSGEKRVIKKKIAHMRVIFSNALAKRARKKLISMYEAVYVLPFV